MTAQLHTERIGSGHTLLLTHGIYGSGANWRTIAKKLVAQRPDWSVLLVDLRGHGRSEQGAPPHTLAAVAGDLRAVIEQHAVVAIAGHSFGGKSVLAARSQVNVAQTWVFDASPSARPDAFSEPDNSVLRVLALLERKRWPSREAFVAAVTADGHALALAQWLAMNLVADGDDFAMRLDADALRSLLTDYYAVDLWDALYDEARGPVEIVIAERAGTISEADRTRLASAPSHVHVHRIPAAHWLHIEAPDAVVALLASQLRWQRAGDA